MKDDSSLRIPGECRASLIKSNCSNIEYKTILAGETKLVSQGMTLVSAQSLGLSDEVLKVAIDDGSHLVIHELLPKAERQPAANVFEGLKSAVSSFSVRQDGKLYACGLQNGSLVVLRNDNARLGVLRNWRSKSAASYPVSQIAFLSSKVHIVSIDAERAMSIWDLSESSEPIYFKEDIHSGAATSILPWPEEKKKSSQKLKFLIGFEDGTCQMYNIKIQDEKLVSVNLKWSMRVGQTALSRICWRNMKNEEFVAAHGSQISVCTREKILFAHQIHLGDITDMKCTDQAIVTGSIDGSVKVISVSSDGWTLLQRINAHCSLRAVVCDSENHYLGYADSQGKYRVCRVIEDSEKQIRQIRQHRIDQPWGGHWEKLMNQHRYRESLLKASSTTPADPAEFRTAIQVFEALIECGLTEKAADGLTLSELGNVLKNLTTLIQDHRAFWCQLILLIILKQVLRTNAAYLHRSAEEEIVGPLYDLKLALTPRSSFSAQKNATT